MSGQRNYYMVRAMDSSEESFKVFFENSVVATGWSYVDFTDNPAERVIEKVKEAYYKPEYGVAPQVVGKKMNEIRRFINMKKGDFVIVPFYDSIRIAVALGEASYCEKSMDADLSNQQKVKYHYDDNNNMVTIPRVNLSESLQRRLRVRGTSVSDLYEFSGEIEKLFNDRDYSYVNDVSKADIEHWEAFKRKLLENICRGKTGLKTGGIGLENLVKILFECEGYEAKICGKNRFPDYGDADVEAVKSDKFINKKILAQVKHHIGNTNSWGVEQLIKVIKSNEYEDYSGVLITSANVPEEVVKIAKNADIGVIDGMELVEWIIEHLQKLDGDIKSKLGISRVPRFAADS